MSDSLKKPVHIAILKQPYVDKLAKEGKFEKTPFGVDPKTKEFALPKEVKKTSSLLPTFKSSDLVQKSKTQLRLKVVHDSIPPIKADRIPPCDTCKTAACCKAFVVNITEMEYESGLYGDAAIKMTSDIYKQLNARFTLPLMLTAPKEIAETAYYLEGKIGQACPFLTESNRCGIYDIRPITCRTYSCVGDERITEGMRQGTEPITERSLLEKEMNKRNKG